MEQRNGFLTKSCVYCFPINFLKKERKGERKMAGKGCLNQLMVDTVKKFFEISSGDVVSPYVLKQNYTQEGIIKHFDKGHVPHREHREYDSSISIMQDKD